MTLSATSQSSNASKLRFKTQGNACAMLIEAIDWSKTSLGPLECWPATLHITLSYLLNSKIPLSLFWGEDHIFFYNDAMRSAIGTKQPELLGKKGRDIWGEHWIIYKPLIDRARQGDATLLEDQAMPLGLIDNKIELAYNTSSYSAVYDELGNCAGVIVASINTTSKINELKKLEESNRNLQELLAQAPIGIAIVSGKDFRFELANEYYKELIGVDNVNGRPIGDLVNNDKHGNIKTQLLQVRETGVAYHVRQSTVHRDFDGVAFKRYTNIVYEPLRDADGKIDRILILANDVSEQVRSIHKAQEAEKELRQMANAMPHLVWIANPDGITTYISDRIAEFSGATRKADGSWRWEGMIHPEDVESTAAHWNQALAQKSLFEKEHRLMMLDGTYKWHITRAHPFRNAENKVTKWFGTATNIDDQKKLFENLEQRVSERTRELQSSNNELAQFAYVASHDLQEPLRKIITFIELLQRDLEHIDEKPKSYLQKIERSAERMSTLIKDILNYSQLGKPGNRFETINLNETLATVAVDLEVVIQQKNATITCENLPTLEAMPQQMNQLFYNLLSNSLKFAREAVAPLIRIRSRTLSRKEVLKFPELNPTLNYLLIEFEDNGIGFNQKFADQIFTIFQRLNTRQAYSGTGIGLALCRKIALNHNGIIKALSTENKGSVFQIILPEKQY